LPDAVFVPDADRFAHREIHVGARSVSVVEAIAGGTDAVGRQAGELHRTFKRPSQDLCTVEIGAFRKAYDVRLKGLRNAPCERKETSSLNSSRPESFVANLSNPLKSLERVKELNLRFILDRARNRQREHPRRIFVGEEVLLLEKTRREFL